MNWFALAVALASDAPHLLPEFVKLIDDIRTGKGGITKLLNVFDDAKAIVPEVVAVVHAAGTAATPAQAAGVSVAGAAPPAG